ncbi:MAG: hypothetical protein ABSH12_06195 [Endomicrobiales bacterium]|jgi:ABC-type nickel/cobalt efflux system permease component RcnA
MINCYKDISRKTYVMGMQPLDAAICVMVFFMLLQTIGTRTVGALLSVGVFIVTIVWAMKWSARTYSYKDLYMYFTMPARFTLEKEYVDNNNL